MNISDCPESAKNQVLDTLYAASAEKPASRRILAEAGSVAESDIVTLLMDLRMQGYLVLEDDQGSWLAATWEEYEQWRDNMLIPAMVHLLRLHSITSRVAAMKFKPNAAFENMFPGLKRQEAA